MIYLLDSDHATVIQRRSEGVEKLLARLRNVAPDDYGTTVITYEEQCKGWLNATHRAQTSQTRVTAYAELRSNLAFFSSISVWEYDATADAEFVRLVQAKVRIGTQDLKIASLALANNATVLTRNTRDIGKVPGLLFADWTI